MRINTLAAFLLVVLFILSGCEAFERKRTQFGAPPDPSTFMNLSYATSEYPDGGFRSVDFNSSELQTCRVIRGTEGSEIDVDTIELSFKRSTPSPDEVTESATLYFPYIEGAEKKNAQGDLALYLKRVGQPLNIMPFDSFNKGQDRTQCVVEYQTGNGKLSGSLTCPMMATFTDTDEALDVRGQFSCKLKRD